MKLGRNIKRLIGLAVIVMMALPVAAWAGRARV